MWGMEFSSENGQGKAVYLTDLERLTDLEESILGYSLNKYLETAAIYREWRVEEFRDWTELKEPGGRDRLLVEKGIGK